MKKNVLQQAKKQNKIKKFISDCQKTGKLDNVDSLKDLKYIKNINDIDYNIKVLKLELKSLMEKTNISEKIPNDEIAKEKNDIFDLNSCSNCNLSDKNVFKNLVVLSDGDSDESVLKTHKKPLEIDIENSTLEKNKQSGSIEFSKWLSSTIDLIDTEIKELKTSNKEVKIKACDVENYSSYLSCQKLPVCFKDLASESKCSKISILPQYKVERLLYKSFLMQNLDKYLSSSDDSDSEKNKPFCDELKKQKFTNSKKSRNGKFFQKRQKKSNKAHKNSSTKRRKIMINKSFESGQEIVNLNEDSSTVDLSESTIANEKSNFNIENLDWSEPFYLDEDPPYCSSVLELNQNIVENNEKKVLYDIEPEPILTNITSNLTEISKSNTTIECDYDESFSQINGGTDIEKNKTKEIKPKQKFWECPICFEPSRGQEIVTTLCGHIFCKLCIENYFSVASRNCPSCRIDLKEKQLIVLFNF